MKDDLEKSTILETATLRDALIAINAGILSGAVMVNREDGRLCGVMTDGDLRRMLLSGVSMDEPVTPYVTRDFTWVDENASRSHVLDLIRARVIKHVPVVNDEMKLVGVHLLEEMIAGWDLPNEAVIMAGGRGARLGDLTNDLPKPMLRVAGRPILERIVIHLVGAGIKVIHIAVNYRREVIEDYFGDGSRFGCAISYLRESEPMGSGGALSLLPKLPQSPLLVMNGDLVSDFSLKSMLHYHQNGKYAATMALSVYSHKIPFGCVDFVDGTVVALREKPSVRELVNAGIYVISPEVLHLVPNGFFPITELLQSCLKTGRSVGGYLLQDDWADVGTPIELFRARGEI
jgi:dTDP-glucose pyrophosphorylase